MSKKQEKDFQGLLLEFLEESKKIQKELREVVIRIDRSLKKCDHQFVENLKSVKNQERYLRENNKLHQMVDESLGNMLLAINQNSFLHAWYPEQHEYPEMKVVGQHPCKTSTAKLNKEV